MRESQSAFIPFWTPHAAASSRHHAEVNVPKQVIGRSLKALCCALGMNKAPASSIFLQCVLPADALDKSQPGHSVLCWWCGHLPSVPGRKGQAPTLCLIKLKKMSRGEPCRSWEPVQRCGGGLVRAAGSGHLWAAGRVAASALAPPESSQLPATGFCSSPPLEGSSESKHLLAHPASRDDSWH